MFLYCHTTTNKIIRFIERVVKTVFANKVFIFMTEVSYIKTTALHIKASKGCAKFFLLEIAVMKTSFSYIKMLLTRIAMEKTIQLKKKNVSSY